jgi:hypothetical protein
MRYDSLDDVLEHVWSYIESAADDPSHAARTPTFCSDGPDARTIVIRRANRETRRLAFHTDTRSGKLDQLRRRTKSVWHHWNPELRQQFRFYGRSTLHIDDQLADDVWASQGDEGRAHYEKNEAPGTIVERPRSGRVDTDPEAEPVDDPREHFGVVSTTIDRIDWLHLHPEGHYRADFQWTSDQFEGRWLLP